MTGLCLRKGLQRVPNYNGVRLFSITNSAMAAQPDVHGAPYGLIFLRGTRPRS
jgi:hypothetical protein